MYFDKTIRFVNRTKNWSFPTVNIHWKKEKHKTMKQNPTTKPKDDSDTAKVASYSIALSESLSKRS